ncbi:MAG: ribosomal-protein-alanine N-acetyltransferase, partial [Hydrogenophaga sp.]
MVATASQTLGKPPASAGWPTPAPPATSVGTARRVAFAPMTAADLDAVQAVEAAAYPHPWSRKHFADSLASGYAAIMLLGEAAPGELV